MLPTCDRPHVLRNESRSPTSFAVDQGILVLSVLADLPVSAALARGHAARAVHFHNLESLGERGRVYNHSQVTVLIIPEKSALGFVHDSRGELAKLGVLVGQVIGHTVDDGAGECIVEVAQAQGLPAQSYLLYWLART